MMTKQVVKNIMVVALMSVYDSAFSQDFSDSFSKKYESSLIKEENTRGQGSCITKFNLPILETAKGNSHICDIRFSKPALEIILAWDDSSHGKYQYVKVPWKDIFSGTVKYGLAEYYSVTGLSVHDETPPFKTRIRDSLLSKNEIGHKTVSGKRINASKNKMSIQSETKRIDIVIPPSYTIVCFDATTTHIFVAVDSDQGHHDGELLLPFLTTQVFLLPMPH